MANVDSVSEGTEIVRVMIGAIVDSPEGVAVIGSVDDRGVLLTVTVSPEDLGRVIGKEAGTINAIRRYMHALGQKNDAFYSVKVVGRV
jgi:uncharacterized protein